MKRFIKERRAQQQSLEHSSLMRQSWQKSPQMHGRKKGDKLFPRQNFHQTPQKQQRTFFFCSRFLHNRQQSPRSTAIETSLSNWDWVSTRCTSFTVYWCLSFSSRSFCFHYAHKSKFLPDRRVEQQKNLACKRPTENQLAEARRTRTSSAAHARRRDAARIRYHGCSAKIWHAVRMRSHELAF